jgi:serine/threonine protein kinase
MSSRTLNNVVNEQTVTLNALIYGYAGHSLVTPHSALQQIWWTEERINEKVTTDFITSRLRPDQRQWLDRPVGFGDLTDDTYMDWILEKARRLFLVLVEVGEADKIFTVVENSWDDDDLPLQMDDIEKLELSNRRNDQVNARFYHTQFTFLLRELDEGVHVDYAPNEVLPLEYVMGLPPAVSLQHWSRVHRPKKPNEVYVRRKFPLGNAEDPTAYEMDFIMDVESARMVEHEHIAPVWASYTAKGTGYIITNFVGQHTLRTFIDHRNPAQYQRLPKPERRYLVLGWLHCLSDAIATLHQMGFCHSSIRPSNILIDEHNNIAFSDIGSLETFQKDKKPDAMEAYAYSAPETQSAPQGADNNFSTQPVVDKATRKHSIASKSSSGSSNSNGSQRQKLSKMPTSELSSFNFGFKKTKPIPQPRSRRHETEKADIFSLGCVFLELLTFMLKKKPHDFTKHRSSKQKINMGGSKSRTDSSFHANPEKTDSWMKIIEDASFAQEDDAFRAVPHVMNLIRAMLSRAPSLRPSARDVRDRLLEILSQHTSIPNIHCSEHKYDIGFATSSNSSSDRASTMSSSRASTMSMSTVSSDADTIRFSTASSASTSSAMQVSSILNSYSDRSTLASVSEYDDTESIRTIGREPISPVDLTSGDSRSATPRLPTPPMSPMSPMSPTSPGSANFSQIRRPSSPSSPTSPASPTSAHRFRPWSKPFVLLP